MGDITESKPWIVVLGGFLGAGKTTLILAAARELERRGKRCAILMNDQGSELVDTRLAELHGLPSGEVTGGCFCCRFSGLMEAAAQLRAFAPDVIFAEPVGSCADIVATVLRPLEEYRQTYRIAPFTVVIDPQRANALNRPESDADLGFLFRKQMEEADLLCFNKADLYPDLPDMPGRTVRQISAATGQGVSAWLSEVLSGTLVSSRDNLDIDYEQYARAEAALTWLNFGATLRLSYAATPLMAIGPFLDALVGNLTDAGVSIVHLKMIAAAPTGFVKAAMCSNDQEPQIEGNLDASPSETMDLLLNLRALGPVELLRASVEAQLTQFDGTLDAVHLECFTPAAPKPERRILAPH